MNANPSSLPEDVLTTGDRVCSIDTPAETGRVVAVNSDGTVDVQDTSFARNSDGSPAAAGRIYRNVPADRLRLA